ncbi:MAG: UbiA family prenyltransferase [Phycisphaerales bacterium]
MIRRPSIFLSLIKLARPWQWGKSVFVLVGPFYGFQQLVGVPPEGAGRNAEAVIVSALIAALAFALVSSGCYVVNDVQDAEADRLHPRKKNRPIAAGYVSISTAWGFALVLFAAGGACVLALPSEVRVVVGLCLSLYAANVLTYSAFLKHRIIADVMSLSLGFVLRMLGGCAAVAISPTSWLLNVTLFLSMFLAFGKRLGERRTLAGTEGDGGAHRPVQALYTDTLLQMMVVVTAVITLMTYALYLNEHAPGGEVGRTTLPVMWLTVLPATYGLLRCIVLLEKGKFDDPTEVARRDRGVQVAALVFIALTAWAAFGG